jgi:hypothetical protein
MSSTLSMVFISCLAWARGSRLDRIVLGDFGEHSQGKVLPTDTGGSKTVDRADGALGAGGSSDRPDPEAGPGVTGWAGGVSCDERNRIESDSKEIEVYVQIETMRTLPAESRIARLVRQPAEIREQHAHS